MAPKDKNDQNRQDLENESLKNEALSTSGYEKVRFTFLLLFLLPVCLLDFSSTLPHDLKI
jgi:hypothetical protein